MGRNRSVYKPRTAANPNGRSSKYKSWFPIAVEDFARRGYTLREMAKELDVGFATFRTFIHRYPALRSSLKKGRIPADAQVESALLRNALGFEYDEISESTTWSDKDGRKRTQSKTRKFVLPNVTAQIFWLKCRRPERWREKSESCHTGKVELVFDQRLSQV